jgi:hypothetical protein
MGDRRYPVALIPSVRSPAAVPSAAPGAARDTFSHASFAAAAAVDRPGRFGLKGCERRAPLVADPGHG